MILEPPHLSDDEWRVIERINQLRSSLRYATDVSVRWSGSLMRAMRARAILGSNSIEGYEVSASDALAAVEGEEPFEAPNEETRHAIVGYRDAMTYVLQLADDPHFEFSEGFIRSMHYMMLKYDLRKHPGRWRPGPIYVRDEQKHEIVYEGPAAEEVPQLMAELIDSLREDKETPAVVRGAMAHLNLVMIHPFSDGNGRMARCLQTLVLATSGIVERHFCSIEEWLGANTAEYYSVLKSTGQGSWQPQNDTREWIRFNLKAHYQQGMTLRARARETAKIWHELEQIIAGRRLPERVIYALFDATVGFAVRNTTYRNVAEISETLASRDLKQLVDAGLLVSHGQTRGRVYLRSSQLAEIRRRTREPKIAEDPFMMTQTTLPFERTGISSTADRS